MSHLAAVLILVRLLNFVDALFMFFWSSGHVLDDKVLQMEIRSLSYEQRFKKPPEHGASDRKNDHTDVQRRFIAEKPVQSVDESDPCRDRHRK